MHSYILHILCYKHIATKKPTYGEMIDLLTEVEQQDSENIVNTLFDKFIKLYPNVMIGRPGRFYDSVKRIAAPTRPSLVGPSKLSGSPLASYRKRIWVPKVQQAQGNESMRTACI